MPGVTISIAGAQNLNKRLKEIELTDGAAGLNDDELAAANALLKKKDVFGADLSAHDAEKFMTLLEGKLNGYETAKANEKTERVATGKSCFTGRHWRGQWYCREENAYSIRITQHDDKIGVKLLQAAVTPGVDCECYRDGPIM